MSFLQRFLERVLRNAPARMPRTTFDDLSQDQLDAHLRVGRYGTFTLTDAVRPSFGLEVIPREGYRRDVYRRYGVHYRTQLPLDFTHCGCGITGSYSNAVFFDIFAEGNHAARSGRCS